MKVKELIEQLSKLDQDLDVNTVGGGSCDGEPVNIDGAAVRLVGEYNYHMNAWAGSFLEEGAIYGHNVRNIHKVVLIS